jgi:hypothetical protein
MKLSLRQAAITFASLSFAPIKAGDQDTTATSSNTLITLSTPALTPSSRPGDDLLTKLILPDPLLKMPTWQHEKFTIIPIAVPVEATKNSLLGYVTDFIKEHYFAISLTVFATWRTVTRKQYYNLNVDMVRPAIRRDNPDKPEGTPILHTNTVWTGKVWDIFGIDPVAAIRFNIASHQARNKPFLPIMHFSNHPIWLSNFLGNQTADDVIGRGFRSFISGIVNENQTAVAVHAARARFNGDQAGTKQESVTAVYSVFTCEDLGGIHQSRAYLIPCHDVINILVDMKHWWELAKKDGDGSKRRVVRLIEMATCFLLRYPKAFNNEDSLGSNKKVKEAIKIANSIKKILALNPDPSAQLIEGLCSGKINTTSNELNMEEQEWRKVLKIWYGTEDPEKQDRLFKLESDNITNFKKHLELCEKHNIPNWFTRLWVDANSGTIQDID